MKRFNPVTVRDMIVQPMMNVNQAFVPAVVSGGKDVLPPEAQAAVSKLVKELSTSKDYLDYGKDVSIKLSSYADKMLEQVALVSADEFTKPLTDVLVLCTNVNSKTLLSGKASKIPFVQRIMSMFANQKAKAMSQFNSVKGQIDDIILGVETKEKTFRNLIKMLEDLYVLNMNDYYMLEAHIRAAEEFKAMKEKEYVTFATNNAEAMASNPLLVQQAADIQRSITKIDRKLHDLRAIQMSCVQFAPQIRREQDNSERLIEKFNSIKTFAIPLWKKQAAAYITSLENKSGVALADAADATTNTLYRTHLDTVNKNAADTARSLESGVISMDTLEYANQSLIQSVKEVLQIAEEGSKYRAEALPKFESMKKEIYQNVIQPVSVRDHRTLTDIIVR
jgi:uncharacterized protein YaaN involved in tellurite resistance